MGLFKKKKKKKTKLVQAQAPSIIIPGRAQRSTPRKRGRLNRGTASRYAVAPGSWAQSILATCAHTKSLAISATPHTEIVLTNANGGTTFHGYDTAKLIETASLSAVQGEARKRFVAAALTPVAPAVASTSSAAGAPASTNGETVWGYRLRISGSMTTFNFRPFVVSIGNPTGTGAAEQNCNISNPVATFTLLARRLPIDVFFLSVSNAAGLATVSPGGFDAITGAATISNRNALRVLDTAPTASTEAVAVIESLTARDLLARGAFTCSTAKDEMDEFAEYDEYVQEGIRDEEDSLFYDEE